MNTLQHIANKINHRWLLERVRGAIIKIKQTAPDINLIGLGHGLIPIKMRY